MIKEARTDQKRLAHIRMEAEKWLALRPDAETWDTVFLIRIIDRLIAEKHG